MGTVVIGSTTYTIYGTHTGAGSCDEYASASLAYSAIWAAAAADSQKQQKQALVEATRVLARLPWADDTYGNPATVGLPQPIIDACYELALAGLADASIFTAVTTDDKIKRVEAKGVEVEWFAPRKGGRLPGRVAELVSPYLEGAGTTSIGGSYASGVDGESQFDDCDGFGVTGGG